jgi:aryl-alcohol dehydrogenase-like predicted oxidoreductase
MSSLPTRKLGSQGCEAAAVGFGCMSLTPGFYGAGGLSDEAAIPILRRALELGVTLFNTSDLYGPFTNEMLLSNVLPGTGAVIATKYGPMFKEGKIIMDGSRENVRRCCLGSLERLKVPTLDIFTFRGPPDPKFPIEETMAEVKELIQEGKVRYVGLSEVNSEDIRRAHAVVPITAIELEWSLFTRDAERDIVPTCRELGIGIMAYSPLGRGLLAGRFAKPDDLEEKDWRRTSPRFVGDNFENNLKLVQRVKALAEKKRCTPGQLALAWLLHQGDDIIPIPGTKNIKYLEENVGALNVNITKEEMKELEDAVPEHAVAGERYPNMHGTYNQSNRH